MKIGKDFPSRLLAAAVARMPEHRREWGEAMKAELACLQDSGCRWGFAVSCLSAALFPPGRFESISLISVRGIVAALAAVAFIGFALAVPEISGAGLAWAYTIYGIAVLVIPTALFGNLLVLAGVVFVVTGHARGWKPWPRTPWLRSWGRLAVEVVFGLLNPLLYLAVLVTAFALRPPGSELWFKPLIMTAWTLLFAFWIARACGAAFNPQSRLARVGVRALLLASLACLLAFTLKDAWLFMETTREEGSLQARFLNLLRLCPLYLIPAMLLWDYLCFSSMAPPIGKDQEEPARRARGFFLLPDPASRFFIVLAVVGSVVTLALAAHRRSEGSVRQLVITHQKSIVSASARYKLDPRLVASIVYVTHRDHLSPFRETIERLIIHAWGMNLQRRGPGNERWEDIGTDENPILNVALDISVGIAQIKPRTAQTASLLATGLTADTLPDTVYHEYRNVEPVGEGWPSRVAAQVAMPSPIPVPATRRSVALMLLKPESNLDTCALILALYEKQWEAVNPDWSIRQRPDILATLYQIGFARSKPHGAPRSNAFGARVQQVYEQAWLNELFKG